MGKVKKNEPKNNRKIMNSIQNLWEDRSKKYKNDVKGVLPKSFPNWLNLILHNWMYKEIRSEIHNGDKVLDLGCGYGRVAKEIVKDFKKAFVNGVDISQTYVNLFNKNIKNGKAYEASITKLPFHKNSFDVVYMVTTLMYLVNTKDQKNAVAEIIRVLKPGGKFIFIERNPNGFNILTLWGLVTLIRGKKNKEIDSVSFTPNYLNKLIKQSGGKVKRNNSFPTNRFLEPSLYVSYVGEKSK